MRALALTCDHFGRDQICTQVNASFYRLATQRKSLRKFNLALLASPFDQGFSLYVLISYFRPRDALIGICFLFFSLVMRTFARAGTTFERNYSLE